MKDRATVITVGSPKGGVGKSTVAINLAIEGIRRGKKVLLMDADEQATVDKFIVKRSAYLERKGLSDADDFEYVIQRSNIPKFLRQNINRYDWIIIDTSGKQATEFVMAGTFSDVILSPTTSCEADSNELETLVKLVNQMNTMREANGVDPIKCHTFINKVDSRSLNTFYVPARNELRDKLLQDEYVHVVLMKQYLTHYGVYQRMHKEGYGICETKDKGKGQFQVFVNEICSIEEELNNE